MADRKKDCPDSKPRFSPHWVLFILTLGVLILSSLAFIKPAALSDQTQTPSPSEGTLSGESVTPSAMLTGTPEAEQLPPTPEEIGYTDGIIFCSTVLVLILLVGTLRETMRRESR
jgi:hypothetical protein